MNSEIFERIYKSSQYSRLQEFSYDMNTKQIIEFFKKELFHPTSDYTSEMKAAMSACIRILSNINESEEYQLYDVYRILESFYRGVSKLSEGVYADNLGKDIDVLVRKAEESFDILANKRVELGIKDSKIDDVENKLFAIANIYTRTLQLIKNNDNFRNEEKEILIKLRIKLNTVIRDIFEHIKKYIINLNLRGITLYHSVGSHEEIKIEDLNLDWYRKNLKFADKNAINNAFDLIAA